MISRWLLYAFGGGLGHFQRGFALARAAARHGIRSTLLTNSPHLNRLFSRLKLWQPDEVEIQCLATDITPEESAAVVRSHLHQASVLVVDTFPRGLGGELAGLLDQFEGYKVWVHRDISAQYLEQFAIRQQWAPRYDCILAPGERGELADLAYETPPWLVLDQQEIASRAAASESWSLDPDGKSVFVVGSGKQTEVEVFARIAARLQADLVGAAVRFAGLNHDKPPWPLLASLRAADIVIGAGGYNTVSESNALQIPLIGIPQPRMYDRQSLRLKRCAFSVVEPGADIEDRVLLAVGEAFACCGVASDTVSPLRNGAEIAFQTIASHAR